MNKPVLIIEAPRLDDEIAATLQDFFYGLMDAFDAHYCSQIERHYRHMYSHKIAEDQSLSWFYRVLTKCGREAAAGFN